MQTIYNIPSGSGRPAAGPSARDAPPDQVAVAAGAAAAGRPPRPAGARPAHRPGRAAPERGSRPRRPTPPSVRWSSTRRCGRSTCTRTRCCSAATCSCAGPWPPRRAADGRGRRRAPGLLGRGQVAAPPQHRAQRRPQRRRDELAVASRWPPRTWRSLPERALFLADRAHRARGRSGGRVPADPHPRGPRGVPRGRRAGTGASRPACSRSRARTPWARPLDARRARRGRVPDDLARPLLRHGVRRFGARHGQGRPDGPRPRAGPRDGGAA